MKDRAKLAHDLEVEIRAVGIIRHEIKLPKPAAHTVASHTPRIGAHSRPPVCSLAFERV